MYIYIYIRTYILKSHDYPITYLTIHYNPTSSHSKNPCVDGPWFRGRKIYVSNLRSKDGRKRVPKLTILDSEGSRWCLGRGQSGADSDGNPAAQKWFIGLSVDPMIFWVEISIPVWWWCLPSTEGWLDWWVRRGLGMAWEVDSYGLIAVLGFPQWLGVGSFGLEDPGWFPPLEGDWTDWRFLMS